MEILSTLLLGLRLKNYLDIANDPGEVVWEYLENIRDPLEVATKSGDIIF